MKTLGTRGRWAVYGIALAITLLAVRWAGGQDDAIARPSREARDGSPVARSEGAAPRETLPALDIALLGTRAAGESARDLFPAVSWEQRAREEEIRRQPPRRPAPPPPPQAPPLPFTYLGQLVEDGKATVFLVQGDRNLIAQVGETLQGGWRVDAIAEQSMTLTYVPLAKQQTLSFAAAAPAARAAASASRDDEDRKRDD